MKIEELSEFKNYFTVIVEPLHSQSVIIEFEQRYQMNTVDFLKKYNNGELKATEELKCWLYHYEKFIKAEGNIANINSIK